VSAAVPCGSWWLPTGVGQPVWRVDTPASPEFPLEGTGREAVCVCVSVCVVRIRRLATMEVKRIKRVLKKDPLFMLLLKTVRI